MVGTGNDEDGAAAAGTIGDMRPAIPEDPGANPGIGCVIPVVLLFEAGPGAAQVDLAYNGTREL